MANKRMKIMLTYVITIVVTVIVILAAGLIMLKTMSSRESVMDLEVTSAEPEEYAPSVLDNQTTLFIFDTEDRLNATVFLLTRMLPSERKIIIVPLQSDMYASAGGAEGTLYDIYRSQGVQGAKRAVESVCGLAVEKYMLFDKDGFEKMAAHFETVSYIFPYSLIYENEATGEVTVIREGNEALDAASLRKAFTYPNYKNGEKERSALIGSVTSDIINYSNARFRTNLDQIVSGVLGCCTETDITEYDYDFKKEAMMYMTERENGCAETVLPSGQYDEYGRYVLDPDFVSSLKTWFSLDIYSTEEIPAEENITLMPESDGVLPAAYSAEVMQ